MTIDEIANSVLFLTIAPKIKSIGNNELLEALHDAANDPRQGDKFRTNQRTIMNGLWWTGTPQGGLFWTNLHQEELEHGD